MDKDVVMMFKKAKVILVVTAISALFFSSGVTAGTTQYYSVASASNPAATQPAPADITAKISVSPEQTLGEGSVSVSYSQSKTGSLIRVFSIDKNALLTTPGDSAIYSGNSGTANFAAPAEAGHYTFRLYDPDTREVLAESNVLEVKEFTPALTVEKPAYQTGEMINVSLSDGSGLKGAEMYMINSDTGAEVPYSRINEIKGRGNMSWSAPGPGKYQIVHTRDTTGKIIAKSNIFTVTAQTTATNPTSPADSTNSSDPTNSPPPANATSPTTSRADNPGNPAPASGRQNTITLRIGSPYMTVNGVTEPVDSASTKTSPVIVKNRTVLPIRAIIEALGGAVDWDGKDQKVTVKLEGTTIELWINNKAVKVNGTTKNVDVAPMVINGRTMLPVRFISENLGYSVQWDDMTQQVTISTK